MVITRSTLSGKGRARRIGVALTSAGLVGATLAACGGTDEAPASCDTLGMTSVAWAHSILGPVVEAYNNDQTGVRIEYQQGPDSTPDYVQQLTTQQLSGNTPDIFQNQDVFSDQLWDAGFSADLNTLFGSTEGGLTRESFAPAFLQSYIPLNDTEAVTGLPVGADATVVYYNKTVFDAAGVEYPTDDWTYDEFNATAKQISGAGAGQYWGLAPAPAGSNPVSVWQAQYAPAIEIKGGFLYNPDTDTVGIGEPAAIEAWEQILVPWQDGGAPAYRDMSGGTAPDFGSGDYGMAVGVRANLPSFEAALGDQFDVVQMPEMSDGQRPVGGGSYGLGISAASDCQAEAWDFINWFYSNEGGLPLLEEGKGVVPPTEEGIESGSWRELPAPPTNIDAYASAIDDALIFQPLPGGAQATLDEAVLRALQQVLLEGRPIADAFGEAQDTVNEALSRE